MNLGAHSGDGVGREICGTATRICRGGFLLVGLLWIPLGQSMGPCGRVAHFMDRSFILARGCARGVEPV